MKAKTIHGFKAGTVLQSTRYTAVSAVVVSGPKPPRHLGGCKFASGSVERMTTTRGDLFACVDCHREKRAKAGAK